MFDRFRRFLRSYPRRNPSGLELALFIPWNKLGRADAVSLLAKASSKRLKLFKCSILKKYKNHVRAILKTLDIPREPDRVFLMAHPASNGLGFAIGKDDSKVLMARWWRLQSRNRYGILYAHVCEGANILNNNQWIDIFPEWISYDKVFGAYLGSPHAIERWVQLTEDIGSNLLSANSVADAHRLTKEAYQKCQEELIRNGDDAEGDFLNVAHFEEAIGALATSR